MSKLSLFFSLIKDGSWHSTEELSKAMNVPMDHLTKILKLLTEHHVIEYKQDTKRIKLNPKYKILFDENQENEEEKKATGTLIIPPNSSINIQCTKITNLTDNPVELDIKTDKKVREITINKID